MSDPTYYVDAALYEEARQGWQDTLSEGERLREVIEEQSKTIDLLTKERDTFRRQAYEQNDKVATLRVNNEILTKWLNSANNEAARLRYRLEGLDK